MKHSASRLSLISLLILSGFLISSCKKENLIPGEQTIISREESAKMSAFLVNTFHFKQESVTENDQGFIAEGDIYFPKKDFWKHYGKQTVNASARHYQWDYLVTAVKSIDVYIDGNMPGGWRTAIRTAIDKWNELGVLPFELVHQYPVNGVIIRYLPISCTGCSNQTFAYTQYPLITGNPGKYMYINEDYYDAVPRDTKVSVIVHELGHAIGFLHTDMGGGTQIITGINACDNQDDPESIMQSTLDRNAGYVGFSPCDIAAYHQMY